MAIEELSEESGGFLGAGFATHGGGSGGKALAHGGIGEDVLNVAGKFVVSPKIAMHF